MRISKFYINVVNSARAILDEHPAKHYTASALSALVGVGSSQLKTAFKFVTGRGIYAYQLQQRLVKAKQLIEEDNLTLKHIANRAGFRHLSNFATAFKKQFGITPGQYRNSIYGD